MKYQLIATAASTLMLAFLASPAAAQSLRPNGTVDAAGDEDVDTAPLKEGAERPDAPQVQMREAPDVAIWEILFVGDGVPAGVAHAAQDYVGKYATAETIKALAASISAAFKTSQVPLYSFSIPAQNLSDGIVRVRVAEGYVGAIKLVGEVEGGAAPLARRMLEPLVDRRPLTRARYERALLLVKQIPGLESRTRLATMNKANAVALNTQLDTSRPTIGFGFDTRGPSFADDGAVEANANFYSLLRPGDRTRFTVSGTVEDDALRYGSVAHDTPIGSDGMRMTAVGALVRTRSNRFRDLKGKASSVAVGLSHPIVLTARRRLNASFSLGRLDSSNAFLGSVIAQERDWTIQSSLSGALIRKKTRVSGRVTLAKGLDIFDAHVAPRVGEVGFAFVDGLVQISQSIGGSIIFRAAAKGRWTGDALPAAQRFNLGGADFGRAFDDAVLNGDRGYGAYGEAAIRPIGKGAFRRTEIYGFADEGKATLTARPFRPERSFAIGSWGAGMRLSFRDKAQLGVEASKVRHAPAALRDEDWRISLNWSVDFRP